jgi:membrane associated rhomboid family serine protease
MLEDRDYMRSDHEPRVSVTVCLLVINVIIYIAQLIGRNFLHAGQIEDSYFALSLTGLEHGFVWQLLTFQFMHASTVHLLLNSIALFLFGRAVEGAIGGRQFTTLYFSSGVIGGLVQMLYTLVFRLSPDISVVGASAGVMGLIGAFALMNWTIPFTIFLYFFPVTITGRVLFWVSLALAVIGVMTPLSGVADAAHLGGLLFGFFYVRQIVQGRWRLPQWNFPQWRLSSRPASAYPRELAAKHAGKKSAWSSSKIPPDEDLSPDEYLQKEVDPILDKISAHGIQSLTAREREILEKARSRMNKR